MGLLGNLSSMVKGMYTPTQPTPLVLSESLVRVGEENLYNRTGQYEAGELCERYQGWVKIAVSRLQTGCASVPLRVHRQRRSVSVVQARAVGSTEKRALYKRAGLVTKSRMDAMGDIEQISDPAFPLCKLLADAWDGGNGFELIELTVMWLALTGNAYWVKVRPTGDAVTQLWPWAPQYCRPVPMKGAPCGIAGYMIGRGTENEKYYDRRDVVHFRQPNAQGNPFLGTGDLAAVLMEADASSEITRFGLSSLQNGAMPGMIVSTDAAVSEEQRNAFYKAADRFFMGSRKAGRTMLAAGGMKVAPFESNPRELSYLASDKEYCKKIANAFDLPLSLIEMDTAALAQAQEAIPTWQRMAINPRLARIADTINQQLCCDFGEDVFVAFDDAVDRDGEDNLTLNERRERNGLTPLPDGDFVPGLQTQPGGGFGGSMFGNPSPVTPTRTEPATQPKPAQPLDAMDIEAADDDKPVVKSHKEHAHPTFEDWWWKPGSTCKDDKKPREVSITEAQLTDALGRFFKGLEPVLMDNLDQDGLSIDIASSQSLREAFAAIMQEPLDAVIQHGYETEMTAMNRPAPGAFSEAAVRTLDTYRVKLANDVLQTTGDAVSRAVQRGLENGGTVANVVAEVRAVMQTATVTQAMRIAQTETTRAYEAGREVAWIDSDGDVIGKQWEMSGNPCPICSALDGLRVPLGEPFVALGQKFPGTTRVNTYQPVEGPPAHPECRCSKFAVFVEDPKGIPNG